MPKSQRCCIFLLVLGGLHLVTGYTVISGCSGESIILYRNISFNSDNIIVHLLKNGVNNTLLAMWSKQNSDPVKESIENGYSIKVSRNMGNILLHNLNKSDEGKYVIQLEVGTWTMKIEVNLVVLVAPRMQCTPNITRVQNDLVASLNIEDCGNPAAHVSWYKLEASVKSRPIHELQYPGKQKGKTISKIFVGNVGGKYLACAESSAMHCLSKVRGDMLCSYFEEEKDNILATLPQMTARSELSDSTKRTTDIHAESSERNYVIIFLSIGFFLAIVAVIVIAIIKFRRCKESPPSGNPELSEKNGPLITATIESEESPPSENPELSEQKGPLITTEIKSEVVQNPEYATI